MSVASYTNYAKLFDVAPLTEAQWNKIKVIRFPDMGLEEFDFSAVPDQVESVNLAGNRLRALTVPSRLTKLQVLMVDGNELTDIDFPAKMPALRSLTARDNKFAKILLDGHLPNLDKLHLGDNRELEFKLSDKLYRSLSRLEVDNTATFEPLRLSRGIVLS